jgi:hypothetical protein
VLDDWNVVATARGGGFRRAWTLLEGTVEALSGTKHPNVLVARTPNVRQFLAAMRAWELPSGHDPVAKAFSRITPAAATFEFRDANDFHVQMRAVAVRWAEILAGHSFRVRVYRHGFKSAVASPTQIERMLEHFLLEETRKAGQAGWLDYKGAAGTLVVETVDNRGGMSLFSKKEMQTYPFLHSS